MRTHVERKEQAFEPITVTIVIESKEELEWYNELFNVSKYSLEQLNGHRFEELTDPDPFGELSTMLLDRLKKQ